MLIQLFTGQVHSSELDSVLKYLVTGGGIVGGLVAFFRAISEYQLKNGLTRYETFIAQRKEFEANAKLGNVYLRILAEDPGDMSDLPVWDRIYFLVFFENVAIMMNSGLLSPNIVHNTWGNGILRLSKIPSFWTDIDEHSTDPKRSSPYWRVFYQLHADMRVVDNRVRQAPQIESRYSF